jgi:riboflavin kinase/FMN adenylyltransferase
MQVFDSIKDLVKDKNTVLTLGTFDGIHSGHQQILNRLIDRSKQEGCRNLVITFHPHPRTVVSNNFNIKLLTTLDEKKVILEKIGIENLLIINFTKEFASITPKEFIYQYLVNSIGVREIVLGHDHHFGKGRDGNVDLLQKIGEDEGFSVSVVDAIYINDEIVSSTKIRNALNEGNIKKANALLGRDYSFTGTVVSGDRRGRELGYPTANIKLFSQEKLLPAIGVYAVNVLLDKEKYRGLLSIGNRPTFYDEGDLVTEVYIYDFDQEIYGAKVTVKLVERLRGEEKFNSAEELINQMNKDKENGLRILKLNN